MSSCALAWLGVASTLRAISYGWSAVMSGRLLDWLSLILWTVNSAYLFTSWRRAARRTGSRS